MNEFTRDAEYIYINTPYAEVYIPDVLFADPEKKATVASEYGVGIKTIGIFYIRLFASETDSRANTPVRTFVYPNSIESYPSEVVNETLEFDEISEKYRVLKYYKGDILMSSFIKQESTNCELFLNLLTSGKLPRSLGYEDILYAWNKNFEINKVNPGVPSVLLQIIISEMCRSRKNLSTPFRKVAGKGGSEKNDFIAVNMNEVSSFSSVMSALTFERFSDKLTTSLNMSKSGAKQTKSPIEKVISM